MKTKTSIIALTLLFVTSPAFAKKCADFSSHAEAQKFYEETKPTPKYLDRDGDGSACDCLKEGSNKCGSHKASPDTETTPKDNPLK